MDSGMSRYLGRKPQLFLQLKEGLPRFRETRIFTDAPTEQMCADSPIVQLVMAQSQIVAQYGIRRHAVIGLPKLLEGLSVSAGFKSLLSLPYEGLQSAGCSE